MRAAIGRAALLSCSGALRRAVASAEARASNHVNYLHAIFAFAMRREIVDRNPVAVARKPKVARPRVGVYLTVEQVEAIVLNVHDDYLGQADRTIVLTAALTGLRQGELIALR